MSCACDLFLPDSAKPLPFVIWIHRGAWCAGSKDLCPGIFLTGHGFAVASINYRLSQEAVFPAQLDDCRSANRFLRANAKKYNLDVDHNGVGGGCAGGHRVALGGASNKIQCGVDWYGPINLTPDGLGRGNKIDVIVQLLGGTVQEKPELATQANPIKQVKKNAAPFLIMQGDAEHTINPEHSRLLHAALQKAGVETTLKILPGTGHGGPQFNSEESHKLIEPLFSRYFCSVKSTK